MIRWALGPRGFKSHSRRHHEKSRALLSNAAQESTVPLSRSYRDPLRVTISLSPLLHKNFSNIPLLTYLVTAFYDTLGSCFDKVVQQINPGFPPKVYDYLQKNGVQRNDVPARFDVVMVLLTKWLGAGARIIGFQTLKELYGEYSTAASFEVDSSLPDLVVFLRERVLALHLAPKHIRTDPLISR